MLFEYLWHIHTKPIWHMYVSIHCIYVDMSFIYIYTKYVHEPLEENAMGGLGCSLLGALMLANAWVPLLCVCDHPWPHGLF